MKTFKYKFADGAEIDCDAMTMTNAFMEALIEQHGECIYNGFAERIGVGVPGAWDGAIIGGSNTRGDGFKTGFHPGLGMEIKSPKHYSDELKARGLVETGKEKLKDKKRVMKSAIDAETIKEIKSMGGEISGQEADYLTADTIKEA